MNVMTATGPSNPVALKQLILPPKPWWNDKPLVALVRRGPFRDCNQDEFDQAVAVCREKNLSPLSGQLFAFVFNKDDAKKRNMVLVTSIMGYRAIANRSGDYMPGAARAHFDNNKKDPLINPRGITFAEATVERFIHGGWKSLTEEATWESFAPILKGSNDEDDYEWVETGEFWEDSGKPKKRKKLKAGSTAQLMLDPRKDGWIKMGDVMLKKCAEAIGLRRGWPEDLSGLYVEEEVHRAHTLEGVDYTELTPSQVADAAEAAKRVERLGGPAILAVFDGGNLDSVPLGRFADRVLEHTAKLMPSQVRAFVDTNAAAINQFWAHNKTDALNLKKELEKRSAGVGAQTARHSPPAEAVATPEPTLDAGVAKPLSKDELTAGINKIEKFADCLTWAEANAPSIAQLSEGDRRDVMRTFNSKQGALKRVEEAI